MHAVDMISGQSIPFVELFSSNLRLLKRIFAHRCRRDHATEPRACRTREVFSPSLGNRYCGTSGLAFCLSIFLVAGSTLVFPQTLSAAIAFVQGNSADPQTSQTGVTVPYTVAQKAGDLNVVIVGWNDTTAQVNSVTDSKGNVYQRAGVPTLLSGTGSQSIYYARNIAVAAANANVVTVSFNGSAAFPDIRILEYSGIDPLSPLDVFVGATGSSATSSSGPVTTTNASDLLVAANLIQTATTGAGSGFSQRIITSPDADIAEDRVVTTAGSYTGTASLSGAGGWGTPFARSRT